MRADEAILRCAPAGKNISRQRNASGGDGVDLTVTATLARSLSASDRCDRCGARAYVRAVLPGGGDLLFCRHHARMHETKLRQVAIEINEETDDPAD